MKPDLLQIGDVTKRMRDAMDAAFAVHRLSDMADFDAWAAEHGANVIGAITNGHDGVKPEVMAGLSALRIISCYGVGYDSIDAAAAAARGIIVTHTPDVLNEDVADTAIMLMLAAYRRLIRDDNLVRSGLWPEKGAAPLTRSASGRKAGIVGLGRIGLTIARKLAAFDAEILYHSRSRKDVPYRYFANLVEMAREAETLICITPGGSATRHLVNREAIEALGPEGILINVSRGSVIDEEEMVAALRDGRLGGAGLDVFEREPEVPDALMKMDNVVLTPHVGSATVETRRAMGDLAVDNLLRFLKDGKALTPVPECVRLNGA